MSANSKVYYINDSSDSAVLIERSDSREVVLINEGPSRVFFGFNSAISTDSNGPYGLHIDKGQYIVFTRLKCDSDIYARTEAGGSATLMGEIK